MILLEVSFMWFEWLKRLGLTLYWLSTLRHLKKLKWSWLWNSCGNMLGNLRWDLCNGGQNLPPPPGGDRVKVSENSVATSVAPVAPVDISLSTKWINESTKIVVREQRKRRTACITQWDLDLLNLRSWMNSNKDGQPTQYSRLAL